MKSIVLTTYATTADEDNGPPIVPAGLPTAEVGVPLQVVIV